MRALPSLLALCLVGCASSTTPPTTHRGSDAGQGRDGGPGGLDGGPGGSDSGPGSDAGPTCAAGGEDFCTTSCGTTGRATCGPGGHFGPCFPPPEDCNGTDDDCDGMADEDIAPRMCSSECGGGSESCTSGSWTGCSATTPAAETCDGRDEDCDSRIDEGLTRACSTACGSGTETCSGGSFIGCTAPAPGTESCNGSDDDCDGTVDETFRVRTESTTYTVLSGRHAGCEGSAQRMGPECNAAIHRYCGAAACNDSGFGPVENSGDTAYVTCVAATNRNVSFATLASHHGTCDGSAERMGPNCNAAIHRYCASQGFVSGFGPVENSATAADVSCVASAVAEVRTTSYTALAMQHAPCDGSTERWGPNCNAAIHRWCRAQGFESGFGPVENSGDTATVTCVRD